VAETGVTGKSPVIAFVVALASGPLGFFYLGWRYAVAPSLVILPWFLTLTVVNPPVATVVIAADLFILACEARRLTKVAAVGRSRKKALPIEASASNFTVPLLAFSSVILTFGVANAAVIATLFAATLWVQGNAGGAMAMLLVGAPLFTWICSLSFRKAADVIDQLVAEGTRNPFRRGWRRPFSRERGKRGLETFR